MRTTASSAPRPQGIHHMAERKPTVIRTIRISLVGVGVRAIVIEIARIRHPLGYNGKGAHFHRQPLLRSTTGFVRLHIPGAAPHNQRASGELVEELIALPHTIEI